MHTKFHQNQSSGSGEEVENVEVYGRRTDRQTDGRTVCYDNSSLEPSAQVSYKTPTKWMHNNDTDEIQEYA